MCVCVCVCARTQLECASKRDNALYLLHVNIDCVEHAIHVHTYSKLMSVLENMRWMKVLKKSMSSTIASWAPRLDQSIKIFLDCRKGMCLVFVGGCDHHVCD